MRSLTLHIEGMSCGHCLKAVNQALANQPGISVGSVQLGRADLQHDEAVIGPEAVAALVTKAGYPATVQSTVA